MSGEVVKRFVWGSGNSGKRSGEGAGVMERDGG